MISFRNGLYAGIIVAMIVGVYLFQLWQPERQVELHSIHLVASIENKDWEEVSDFLADEYQDQWGHDRAVVLSKLRAVVGYTRNLRVELQHVLLRASGDDGEWRARAQVEADDNEVSAWIKARVNKLDQPFTLKWRKQSWKPWDWKLVHVSNPALELPAGGSLYGAR
jgi:hypothetical protein